MKELTLLPGSVNGPHMINSRVALGLSSGVRVFNLMILLAGPVAAEVNNAGFV
jgi:hypothetical protein